VLEFDMAGNLVSSWGGPGPGYEWPASMHGVTVDGKDNVWLPTNQGHQMLKFTRQGKFLLQIGREGQSKGNTDTANLNRAAEAEVDLGANEVYVADGYGNRRVIVFDADTGAYKRHWGAYGVKPDDVDPGPYNPSAPLPKVFRTVHCAQIANDGLVYVCDRDNQRVQVFTLQGKFVSQVFVSRGKMPLSTSTATSWLGKPLKELEDGILTDPTSPSRTAFSPDPEQRFLYVLDRRYQRVAIMDRKSLAILGYFGGGVGNQPGQFYVLHDLAADSQGNIYTAEVNNAGNRRAQKFVYKGVARSTQTR
jgi:DNA-binding beta-propeller fold protein YncE